MNLNQLAVFHAVAKTLSFTRAASELFLTQPGVSKHVKALETHIGTRLFDRLGKKVVLTQAGEILFETTEEMFRLLDRGLSRIDDLVGLRAGRLTVGASVTIGIYIAPRVIKEFFETYPDVEVALDISLSREVVDKVLDDTIDVGLVGHPVGDDRLMVSRFMQDEFVVVVSSDHDWASRQSIDPWELASQPFLVSRRGSGTKTVVEERLAEEGISLGKATEFGNTEAVKKGVQAGLGAAVLSKYTVKTEIDVALLRAIPIEGVQLTRGLYAVHRKDKHISRVIEEFLRILFVVAPDQCPSVLSLK
ncbi:LysR substrate-binding domain-containing protein [Thermodesulfobacteriota bacterium]